MLEWLGKTTATRVTSRIIYENAIQDDRPMTKIDSVRLNKCMVIMERDHGWVKKTAVRIKMNAPTRGWVHVEQEANNGITNVDNVKQFRG